MEGRRLSRPRWLVAVRSSYLPGCKARRTQQMSTRLNTNVFIILGTDLTQLERRAHLTIQLVLFLSDSNVVLGRVVH